MSLYYLDDLTTIHHGGALDVLRAMPDESVHSIVTDPPYGLSNTDPRHVTETITRWVSGDREYVPSGRGFMGKEWDAFVPPVAVWDECLRVLKPGGHLLAFAGSRTHDLMGLSIRLAGFEMRDSLAWLYGSGFPKSHNVSLSIDKAQGHANRGRAIPTASSYQASDTEQKNKLTSHKVDAYSAKTPEAAQWDGWGTALKPAFEPIVLARKPLAEKTVARNVLAHGTGAINVDACRIATDEQISAHHGTANPRVAMGDGWGEGYQVGEAATTPPNTAGRWPANVLLDQHAAAWVDEQSGFSVSKRAERGASGGILRLDGCHTVDELRALAEAGEKTPTGRDARKTLARYVASEDGPGGHTDPGGASRFFYTAKAPKRERPNVDGVQHPTVKPLAIMRWLIRLVTPPGGVVLDPFAGSGTTIEAALIEGFNPIGIEMEADYLPLIQHRIDRQAGTLTD